MIRIPRLYAIVDTAFFSTTLELVGFAEELVAGGCTLLQYRNKSGYAREMLEQARELKRCVGSHPNAAKSATSGWGTHGGAVASQNPPRTGASGAPGEIGASGAPGESGSRGASGAPQPVRLIMNDRADLCLAAEFDGVHIGQDDLSPEAVRRIIGPERWLGVSTHNPDQIREADRTSADYLAIGPVFSTSSKERPDPVVGLEGVRRAKELTRKPLVAIGGVTRANAGSVIEAGADSVAVISDLLREPRKSAEEFFRILG